VADRLTEEIPGAYQPNQYFNRVNPTAHYETTGPEIWDQTEGQVDVLVAGVGTGGTITGTGRYLKERKPEVLVVGADPEGSVFSAPEEEAKPYLVEGIGEDFWPETFDPKVVDRYVRVSDRDSFLVARRITREEGILVGGSSGTAMHAALEIAGELDASKTIVVIFPDSGRNYLTKLYSDTWMRQYGFVERPEVLTVAQVVGAKHGEIPPLVAVGAHERVRQAVDALQKYGISQAPVTRDDADDVTSLVGSIQERDLLERVFRDPDALQADVAEVMGPPLPLVEADDPIEAAFDRLQTASAVVVAQRGRTRGVITRADLLEFLAHQRRQP
jgi:cystathionine beta-synthase